MDAEIEFFIKDQLRGREVGKHMCFLRTVVGYGYG
jgi:hypothetical protein